MAADPLCQKQNASRKSRLQIRKEKLEKISVTESHNRQVVQLTSETSFGNSMRGSGALIHHIRNSLSDIDCFDWVKTEISVDKKLRTSYN